jgi:putative ABC transport system ATP-binding protein
MSIIQIKDLHKTYDETGVPVHALNGIDLLIGEGEFTAIVGPSGSGKTTLLNIIGGLDKPTRGEVNINGTGIGRLGSRSLIDFRLHNIGFVFQAYNLIPVLTAIENVAFIIQLQGVPKRRRQQRAMELLDAVGIAEKAGQRPAKLSGGQQQRVAVARALASEPRFILADEPTANLDSASTAELLDLMQEMNASRKVTFIFSTHDQRVVEKARRVITIEDGRVASDENRQ